MIIRCWGCRGSIAVSGKEYLKYGGTTTCLEIRTKNDEVIVIDAGSGIRRLGIKLLQEKCTKYHMIFTHSHWDHILGFPFFKPLYIKGNSMDIYGCPFAQETVNKVISGTMEHPHFPVRFEHVKSSFMFHGASKEPFSIDSVTITPISLSHPDEGIGYKFTEDGKTFVFLTDNELTYKHPGGLDYQDYLKFSQGADLLLHDAEYKQEEYARTKTWGHSIYTDALKLALEAKVKKFGLTHHNQERTDDAIDEIVKDCHRIIKDNKSNLECLAVSEGLEIKL